MLNFLHRILPRPFVKRNPYPEDLELPTTSESMVQWMWAFIRPYKWYFWLFTLCRIATASGWNAYPIFVKLIIDSVESGGATVASSQVIFLLLLMLGVITAANVLGTISNLPQQNLSNLMKRQFTLFGFLRNTSLPLSWHETAGTGSIMQRLVTARDAFFGLLNMYYFVFLYAMGTIVVTFVSFAISGLPLKYYLIVSSVVIGYLLLTYWFSQIEGRYHLKITKNFEQTAGKVYEFSSSIFTVKSFSLLPFISKRAWKQEIKGQEISHKLQIFMRLKWFILNSFFPLSFVLTSLYAWNEVVANELSVGSFILILLVYQVLWMSTSYIAEMAEVIFQQRAEFLRGVSDFKRKPEKIDFLPTQSFPTQWTSLTFKDVSLKYKSKPALKHFSLTIPRGQSIALVGKSGAGKTSFVKLFLKLLLPTKGVISFDDVNSKYIPKSQMAKHISVVLQDTELFNASIVENVLMGARTKKPITHYLELAHAWEYIKKLPNKERTVIGERGVRLSGGERQRLGIARALARESEILVFDEATSALDSHSEREIQKAMKELSKTKTMVIIAHRLSTIKNVDRILVFENGRIVEDGSFKQLTKKKNGVFAKMWKLQKID